ncbi:MAG: GDP-L-fucose synthase [Deltaproteobacteria bacterium]|nr:GDP-L-fucose synthase [Deltaproteobacteria bacterium]MBW2218050.1 GDP-L-fucose synthase [Deltaproteobacteria bacterium]
MKKKSKIYLAGHIGLVGSTIMRKLESEGYSNIVTRDLSELDLTRQTEVETFFAQEKPEYVILAAARVGGILANNTYPAEFIYDNIAIQTNIIHTAWKTGVKRLLFLGSSCIYPRECPQPMKEEHLLTGLLEATNEPYAIAKISGIKMCQSYNRQYKTNFMAVMPTNLYGKNDNFNLETSHVLPALIRKFHEAKVANKFKAEVWGTGKPRREFLYVDDLADACIRVMTLEDKVFSSLLKDGTTPLLNIGSGKDISIKELAFLVKDIVEFPGDIEFNSEKPDGTFQKLLDVSRMNSLGWKPETGLKEGIKRTYKWCLDNSIF